MQTLVQGLGIKEMRNGIQSLRPGIIVKVGILKASGGATVVLLYLQQFCVTREMTNGQMRTKSYL